MQTQNPSIESHYTGERNPGSCPMGGVTLVELLATLAIAAILLVIGIPSFQEIVANNRLSTTSNDVLLGLSIAKNEAIRRNKAIRFCLNPSARTWKVSTMASVDLQTGTLPTQVTATSANLDTASVADHVCVRFRADGLSYGSGSALVTNGTITLTLDGKTRVINVKAGALHVDHS